MPNSYQSERWTGPQIDQIYPIGSIYMSVNNIDPGTLFGGTWEAIENTFLVAQGTNFTAGTSGGALNHSHTTNIGTSGGPSNNTSGGPSTNTSGSTALTVAQLPSHNHGVKGGWGAGPSNSGLFRTDQNSPANRWSNTENAGSGQGHTHTLSSHTHTLSSHTHSQVSVGTSSISNLPPYLAVYMWKRTA